MVHRLLMLGYKTLREGVVVSAIFFAASLLLFAAERFVVPNWGYL